MSSENSSNSAVIGGRPVQETNVDYLPSTGRNIPQTVALPPPPGITEKTVQGNFNGLFSKNSTLDESQVSLGDSLVQDAVQDNGPLAESYNAVLQKQEVDPLKRQRDWTEDEVEGYKQMALEKDAEARKWNTHAETLTKENSTLKRDLAIAKTTIMTLKAQVETLLEVKQQGTQFEDASDDLTVKRSKLYQRSLHPTK